MSTLTSRRTTRRFPNAVEDGIFDPIYEPWLRIQARPGQEKIIRWKYFRRRYPGKLRRQTGHEHACSIQLLNRHVLHKMRPYLRNKPLDEGIETGCVQVHDIPEGIIGKDRRANRKTDLHDLEEYLAFEKLFKQSDQVTWRGMQKCFLLQFALKNAACFPQDAREVMAELAETRRREALIFMGVENLDYLLYAYECWRERGVPGVVEEVTPNAWPRLEAVSAEIPAFGRVAWSGKRREFFRQFANGVGH